MAEHCKKQNILIITDSLGLPRPSVGVSFKDTYPYLICSESGAYCMNISAGGKTITEFNNRLDCLTLYGEGKIIDYSVVAIGLVDSAPRLIPLNLRRKMTQLPTILKKTIFKTIHYTRMISPVYIQYTPLDKYRFQFEILLKNLGIISQKIFVILIFPVNITAQGYSPYYMNEIIKYNEYMGEECSNHADISVIDLFNVMKKEPLKYLTDDAHITKEAHRLIASKIATEINIGRK
jgi:hypothetical protein